MDKQLIVKTLIGEFHDKLGRIENNLIKREAKFPIATDKIKVAMGMRRAGKTFFAYQAILDLIDKHTPKSSILYINFEDDRLLPLDHSKLAKLIEALYSIYPENHDRKCYLFLDEIQNVEDWPLVIRRMHDSKNIEIFLTGSSAKLLSKEIATGLRGRSLSTEIWPFSFDEFLSAKKISIDRQLFDTKTRDKLAKSFNLYLSVGGFPEVVSYETDIRQKVLQEYIDIVAYRDIIERHKIKNPTVIKYMIMSMIRNIAKPFTINKFYNDLKSQGYAIGKDSLYEYADHIEDAYLAFSVSLYDKSIRKVQSNPKKIYAIDPGMARAVTLDFENDIGRLFENVIYLDLRRRGLIVNYYLTKEGYEIDFLVHTSQGHKKFFQVAWEVSDKTTLEREQRALQSGMKELNISGELITLESYLQNGINI